LPKWSITIIGDTFLLRGGAGVIRKMGLGRSARIGGAFLSIPLILMLVGGPIASGDVMPARPFQISFEAEGDAGTILASVSAGLSTTALATLAAVAVLLRIGERATIDAVDRTLAAIAALSAVLSYFFGYRFQVDIASQLSESHLNLALSIGRLKWQAYTLVAAASSLFAMAADRLAAPKRRR
jgi:hypothetical protein